MGQKIQITMGDHAFAAELNDTPTAQAIAEILPIESCANCWGDEIYFSVEVDHKASEDARSEFGVGELGYWPPGNAFCIFFGPTPASRANEPRMANPGNPVGWITSDVAPLKSATNGTRVRIEKAKHVR